MGLSTRDGKRFLGTNIWDGKGNLYLGWENFILGKGILTVAVWGTD